ncbi:MAG: hypothetical protein HRU14_03685 [Planctomycetes bacterium]|nr:hypothetical protein [Planctomycetota bacterium]
MTCVLLTLALLLTVAPVQGQDPARGGPGRLFVRLLERVPTERALAAGIRACLRERRLLEHTPRVTLTPRDTVIVLHGTDVSGLSPARLIMAAQGVSSPGPRATVLGHVSLAVPPSRVRRVIRRVLPGTRRVLALGRSASWASIAEDVTVTAECLPLHRAAVIRGVYDALFIHDDHDALSSVEALIQLCAENRVPTVTTAPWLARSSSAIGVIPDLDVAALRIVGLLARPRLASTQVPSLTTIHLEAWRKAGLPSSAGRLAWAHRVHGADAGALR